MAKADHGIRFGTLQPDGTLTNQRVIKRSSIQACPFFILMPEHYREDGSCRCDDPEHRKLMIAEWGYTEDDFKREQD
jgi:hypothetical protein